MGIQRGLHVSLGYSQGESLGFRTAKGGYSRSSKVSLFTRNISYHLLLCSRCFGPIPSVYVVEFQTKNSDDVYVEVSCPKSNAAPAHPSNPIWPLG